MRLQKPTLSAALVTVLAPLFALTAAFPAQAQKYPITPNQRSTAEQVARAGVPLDELAAGAPDVYTVKAGDTLWAISGLYLKRPWRWPELWGMNLQEIRNPHLIFPGQTLYLEKRDGMARLRMGAPGSDGDNANLPTVKLSPRTRYESLGDAAIPALSNAAIEPFLSEPLIVDESGLLKAPRIVATQEGRVLLSRGDRAYALGDASAPLILAKDQPRVYRIFRNVTPLKDPDTGAVLGYEAHYEGKAELVRGQSLSEVVDKDGKSHADVSPATIDIVFAKEEMRVGDRLLPEPPREFNNYVPRAPEGQIDGRVVSVYGSAVVNAAQNQVVVINRGTRDGLEVGNVLALMTYGRTVVDRTGGKAEKIKLPDERNGLLMIFRPFETLSYGLILEITQGVAVGDRVVNPR